MIDMYDEKKMQGDFRRAFQRAEARGVEWKLTFEEWRDWWLTDNRYANRGNLAGKTMMCRISEPGPYSLDNIYPGTPADNMRDKVRNNKNYSHIMSESKKSFFLRNPDHREKMSLIAKEYYKKNRHHRSMPVRTPLGDFPSINAAASKCRICHHSVVKKAHLKQDGFSFIENERTEHA